MLSENQIIYTYLHLASDKKLTKALLSKNVIAIAYETVEESDGSLPLLTPMSEVAGRMSVQIASHYLESAQGGRGKLLGGVPGVRPANISIVGGGTVGINAAKIALGMGANVTIIDINPARLRYLDDVLHGNINTLTANRHNIANAVRSSDVIIGAVLIPGALAPKLVTKQMVASMSSGSVIVDVAIDQGGCIETIEPTSHSDPIYVIDGVIHYGVTNIPGAVPRTSTYALTNATLPTIVDLANNDLTKLLSTHKGLAKGVNLYKGKITCKPVADTFSLSYTPLDKLI